MTKTNADCLRLLPDRRLGSFHRLSDLHHGCQSSRQRTRTFQRKQSGTRVFMRCDAARGAETAWRSSRDGAPVLTCAEFSDDASDGQCRYTLRPPLTALVPATGGVSAPDNGLGVVCASPKTFRGQRAGYDFGDCGHSAICIFPVSDKRRSRCIGRIGLRGWCQRRGEQKRLRRLGQVDNVAHALCLDRVGRQK
jgi:hypothetical protein